MKMNLENVDFFLALEKLFKIQTRKFVHGTVKLGDMIGSA